METHYYSTLFLILSVESSRSLMSTGVIPCLVFNEGFSWSLHIERTVPPPTWTSPCCDDQFTSRKSFLYQSFISCLPFNLSITADIQYASFRCAAYWLGIYISYEVIPLPEKSHTHLSVRVFKDFLWRHFFQIKNFNVNPLKPLLREKTNNRSHWFGRDACSTHTWDKV